MSNIKSTHIVRVYFSPILHGGLFSKEIHEEVDRTIISSGNYSCPPHVETIRDSMEIAVGIESLYSSIIMKHGGHVVQWPPKEQA